MSLPASSAGLVPTLWRQTGSRLRPRRRPPPRPASFCARQLRRSVMASASPAGAESVARRISQGRRLSSVARTQQRQLFGESRTLWITHWLGLDCSMVNLDLAAPGTALSSPNDLHLFADLEAQHDPVADIVQCTLVRLAGHFVPPHLRTDRPSSSCSSAGFEVTAPQG